MEAARVSALRGHDVTLIEKQTILGGLLPIAAMVKGPHPEDVTLIIKYLSGQIRKLGVKVELGKEADVAAIEEMKPDVVFVATGAQQTIPDIKGIDRKDVVAGGDLHNKLKFYSALPHALHLASPHQDVHARDRQERGGDRRRICRAANWPSSWPSADDA